MWIALIVAAIVPGASWTAETLTTTGSPVDLPSLLAGIRAAPTKEEKGRLIGELRGRGRITNGEDLVAVVGAAEDEAMVGDVNLLIEGLPEPLPAGVRGAATMLASSLKDRTEKRRQMQAVLEVCVAHGVKEAIPIARRRIKKISRINIKVRGFLVVRMGDVTEVNQCAWALASLGSLEDMDMLFSRDEVLCLGGSQCLGLYGPPAIRKAAEIIRKDRKGPRHDGAERVILSCTKTGDLPALRELLHDPLADIRRIAVHALVWADDPTIDEDLKGVLNDPDRPTARAARKMAYSRYPGKYRSELLRSLFGEDEGPLGVLDTLSIMRNPEVGKQIPDLVPELERFIKIDEDRNPHWAYRRYRAALVIWRLTGRKILYERSKKIHPGMEPYPWEDPRLSDEEGQWAEKAP